MPNSNQMSDTYINAVFLTVSGGLQDAYTYLCRGKVFANAQTGNIVLMSKHLFERNLLSAMKYFIPVCAFMAGIFTAELIRRHFKHTKILHWRQFVLILEIIMLLFSGFIPHKYDTTANIIISFVCAMQVQSFRTISGLTYASTMCIGNIRYATEALCTYFHTHSNQDLIVSLKYFGVVALFATGAGFGSILTFSYDIYAIWISCLLLLISFSIMLIKQKEVIT